MCVLLNEHALILWVTSKPYVGLQEVFLAFFWLLPWCYHQPLLLPFWTSACMFTTGSRSDTLLVCFIKSNSRFWSTTGWIRLTTGLSKVNEWSSSAQVLLFCFRWNTGACSASAPSAGGRIKTQKTKKKQKKPNNNNPSPHQRQSPDFPVPYRK